MKKILPALAAAALLLLPFKASADDIFAELSGRTHVESSYVSGRFAHNMKTWRSKDYSHSMNLSKGFSALYSYQCYSEEDVKDARRILNDYIKRNSDVELVMRSREGMQDYEVYEKFSSDDKITQMVIWSSSSPNNCEMVVIDWKNGLTPTTPKEK